MSLMDSKTAERFDRAAELADREHYEQALKEYEGISQTLADPIERVPVLLAEVGCLLGLGRIDDARNRHEKAASILPKGSEHTPEIVFSEAKILIAARRRKQALMKLDGLIADEVSLSQTDDPDHLYQQIQLRRGSLLVELYRFEDARPVLEELLAFEIDRRAVAFYLGICYFELREFQLAKDYLRQAQAADLPPAWEWQVHVSLGAVYFGEGAFARARLEYEKAEILGPKVLAPEKDMTRIYRWLEKICRELGDDREAGRYRKLAREYRA